MLSLAKENPKAKTPRQAGEETKKQALKVQYDIILVENIQELEWRNRMENFVSEIST